MNFKTMISDQTNNEFKCAMKLYLNSINNKAAIFDDVLEQKIQ